MKKQAGRLLFLIGCMFLLWGCGKVSAEVTDANPKLIAEDLEEETVNEQISEDLEQQVEVQQTEVKLLRKKKVQSQLDEKRAEIGLTEENLPMLCALQEGNYYYQCLSEEEQLLYTEIHRILTCFESDILLTTVNEDMLGKVYQAVINDHPEIFYSEGFSYTRNTIDDQVAYLTFTGGYTCSKQEAEEKLKQIEAATTQILKDIPAGSDAYTVVKYVYEYIILHTDYGEVTEDHQNICSVFLDKASVCNGYAKAMQYLLNKMGVFCIVVNGTAKEAHAWNIVGIDGAYYHVDVTWGDPSYNNEGAKEVSAPVIDYSYLCVNTEQMGKDHITSEEFELPVCDSMAANYFVREGLYLQEYDDNFLQQIFDQALQSGEDIVWIKAADQNVYDMLTGKLIQDQEIFRYFGKAGEDGTISLAYSQNDAMYTLSFWY